MARARRRTECVGIVGLGYVGLPLALSFAESGKRVIGFDSDRDKIEDLRRGRSPLRHVGAGRVRHALSSGLFGATDDFAQLERVTAALICVPTPLTRNREPDLSHVVEAAERIALHGSKNLLVVLESTTYPGTTREIVKPIFERRGFRLGKDFFLAFSPEREEPGNTKYSTRNIPKVVGGADAKSLARAAALYDGVIDRVVRVASCEVAEATKLLENIFRAVNIALVNELKVTFDRMDIDVWDVVEAASTKPFGFMPFYPGPGLGGHCTPIDPFYLTWKAREFDAPTKFIELAGEVNTQMPYFVLERVQHALNTHRKSVRGAKILVLGVAYKRDIDDTRESPALKLMELLRAAGAQVEYHDPYVPRLPAAGARAAQKSVQLTARKLASASLVLLTTDHGCVDYALVRTHAPLIVDTRRVWKPDGARVFGA
jgi:UDP-N-acetyl-D-glucosamine dehydrogenase